MDGDTKLLLYYSPRRESLVIIPRRLWAGSWQADPAIEIELGEIFRSLKITEKDVKNAISNHAAVHGYEVEPEEWKISSDMKRKPAQTPVRGDD